MPILCRDVRIAYFLRIDLQRFQYLVRSIMTPGSISINNRGSHHSIVYQTGYYQTLGRLKSNIRGIDNVVSKDVNIVPPDNKRPKYSWQYRRRTRDVLNNLDDSISEG